MGIGACFSPCGSRYQCKARCLERMLAPSPGHLGMVAAKSHKETATLKYRAAVTWLGALVAARTVSLWLDLYGYLTSIDVQTTETIPFDAAVESHFSAWVSASGDDPLPVFIFLEEPADLLSRGGAH